VALLAGLIALMAALVIVNPTFGFFTWTGYIWTFRLVQGEGRRAAGIIATAAVTGTSQHGGLPNSTAGGWISWVAVVGINLLAVSVVSWFVRAREREADERQQAIDELTEANTKLEASLRENAGLHAQLVAQAREAGVLDERQRMAREIHDTLAQGLVGIITQLEAAAQAPRSDKEWNRHTDAAVELARESLAEARRSVQALQPVPLEQARLPDALGAVARTWSERSGVPATVTTTGQPRPVAADIEVALLRTAQEALANVARHARAKRVWLTLSYMNDVVTLDVRDDGTGFAAASPGRSRWPQRDVQRRSRVRGDRRGRQRRGRGQTGPRTEARCDPDGPADARTGWGRRDPSARRRKRSRARTRTDHLRQRCRRPTGDRGRRHRLPPQGRPPRRTAPRGPRRRAR
jgi:signal transduction histidine kinase